MLDSHQTYSGTRYTRTFVLVIAASVASPLALLVSRTTSYVSILDAFSILCGAFGWVRWQEYSELTVPSLSEQPTRAK